MEASYTLDLLFFFTPVLLFDNSFDRLSWRGVEDVKGFFYEQTGLINIIHTKNQIFHKIQIKNGHSDINFLF